MKEIITSKGNYKVTKDGDISDGYHSFEELYKHRMLYNAAFFKELSSKFRVERSKRHSDGELCFGGGWFIVVTELPQGGQISNHYENKYWDLFDFCETVDKPTIAFDGHETNDVLERMLEYITSSKNNLTNNDMEYFKKRLIEEEKELAIKVDKLTKFIGSERFNILSETEGALLKRRLVCMNGYLDTLRFENEIMKYKL